MDGPATAFGPRLRRWRAQRGLSQQALALQATVSPRHLSWLETGRASPSRAMVLRLAEQLDLPLRERNTLLAAAGFAPLYGERALVHQALTPARDALEHLLQAHEPWPALALDRHWQMVACNRMVPLLLQQVATELRVPPVNLLRLTLHPRGLAPCIENFTAWRGHVLRRLQRQAAATGDPVLAALHAELSGLPLPAGTAEAGVAWPDDAATLPLVLHTPAGRLSLITAVTVFGTPNEVTLAELAVETLLPADAATAALLRSLQAALP